MIKPNCVVSFNYIYHYEYYITSLTFEYLHKLEIEIVISHQISMRHQVCKEMAKPNNHGLSWFFDDIHL